MNSNPQSIQSFDEAPIPTSSVIRTSAMSLGHIVEHLTGIATGHTPLLRFIQFAQAPNKISKTRTTSPHSPRNTQRNRSSFTRHNLPDLAGFNRDPCCLDDFEFAFKPNPRSSKPAPYNSPTKLVSTPDGTKRNFASFISGRTLRRGNELLVGRLISNFRDRGIIILRFSRGDSK